jgi:hypothetical protein
VKTSNLTTADLFLKQMIIKNIYGCKIAKKSPEISGTESSVYRVGPADINGMQIASV